MGVKQARPLPDDRVEKQSEIEQPARLGRAFTIEVDAVAGLDLVAGGVERARRDQKRERPAGIGGAKRFGLRK